MEAEVQLTENNFVTFQQYSYLLKKKILLPFPKSDHRPAVTIEWLSILRRHICQLAIPSKTRNAKRPGDDDAMERGAIITHKLVATYHTLTGSA